MTNLGFHQLDSQNQKANIVSIMSPLGIEKLFSSREKREARKEDEIKEFPGGFKVGQEVFVDLWGMFGNRGDDVPPVKWEVFGPASKKERQKDEVRMEMTYPDGQKIQKDVPINFLLAEKPKSVEPAQKESKAETKEPQLHGFKIGDKVLWRTLLKENDIFAAKEAEISGPAKDPNQVQIKMDNPNSPFGPKVVYEVRPNDLIKLNEHEQRMAKQLGMEEVRFFKNGLAKIEQMEKRIEEVKSRHIFDKAMEDKILEIRRISQQFKNEVIKDKFEKKRWESTRQELWDVLDKMPDMLDNIEENYPSDDLERIRMRRGYGKR